MTDTKNSVFNTLYKIDVSDKTKEKNKLTYLSWASAWAEVKKIYPDATYTIYPQYIDELGNTRFWHDDGKTGWVQVGVTIDGIEQIEILAIMDYKNQAIPADKITSVDANKSKQRCLVKACAMHGLALHIYEGEDIPEAVARAEELKQLVADTVAKKVALSDKAKSKANEFCLKAVKQAFPDLDESVVSANYFKNIDDVDILNILYDNLLAIRK